MGPLAKEVRLLLRPLHADGQARAAARTGPAAEPVLGSRRSSPDDVRQLRSIAGPDPDGSGLQEAGAAELAVVVDDGRLLDERAAGGGVLQLHGGDGEGVGVALALGVAFELADQDALEGGAGAVARGSGRGVAGSLPERFRSRSD